MGAIRWRAPSERLRAPAVRVAAALEMALVALVVLIAPAANAPGAQASPGAPAQSRAADPRPNVVLIVADDLGSADLAICGATDVATPHLDALASSGARCTQAYAMAPVCAPSRAALLTGRYAQRFGFEFNEGPPEAGNVAFGLPADATTLAERLRAAGYATGMVGKWHLGAKPGQRPTERGFDEFFGFLDKASTYDPKRRQRKAETRLLRGLEPVEEKGWLTPVLAREAGAFIDRHAAHPFFLYVPFGAVHAPVQPDPALAERVAAIADPERRAYANLIVGLDDAVGAVLERLQANGLAANTLVLFTSDNGSARRDGNLPLRGVKSQLLEGGLRVPLLARWDGRIPAGVVYEHPVHLLDLAATVAAASGLVAPEHEGVDLVPFFAGAVATPPHAALFWRYGARIAIRRGDLKLVRLAAERSFQLFDLAVDPAEQRDLATQRPEQVAELLAEWERWNARNVASAWRGREDFAADELPDSDRDDR